MKLSTILFCPPVPLLPVSLLILSCFACNSQTVEDRASDSNRNADPVEGVWELMNRYYVKNGDTLFSDPGSFGLQHKILYDGFVIQTADLLPDSSEWHLYGTYLLSKDTLIIKESMGAGKDFIYRIECDDHSLKQETNTVLRRSNYLLVEEWKKLD